ncbi:lamin-B receptor [Drosophila novamexicana]|uniref:lamin-B receptor n=1 Tax=Drosophila novamexicana TaxID=47314 RepID=UPI0011E5D2E2|nr:lamin-B receptor [Drosophila novamexicana]
MDRRLRRPRRTEDFAPVAAAAAAPGTQTRRAGPPAHTQGIAARTRASPSRNKVLPEPTTVDLAPRTRRSSRPRSAAGQPTAAAGSIKATIKSPTPIKEVNEVPSPVRNSSSFPITLTTNTSSRAPNQAMLTSSVNSPDSQRTYSSSTTTTQRIEIRTEGGSGADVDTDSIRKRITDRLRRSLSKTISNVAGTPTVNREDASSRYSRSVSRSVYDDEKSSRRSYSTGEEDIDEEDEQLEDDEPFRSFNVTRHSTTPLLESNVCRKLQVPREFGGWPGALLLLVLMPGLVYYLTWSCTARNACQLKRTNLTVLLDWHYLTRQVFQTHVVGVFTAYQFVVFLLVALLPGRRVHLTRETYKFNGLGVCFTLLIAGGIVEYLKYPIVSFVLRHYLRFCIYGLVSAFVAASWSYWRVDTTKYNVLRQTLANDYGRSGNFLVDFALGRQLNPKWLGRVDWKQYYYRLSLVSTLLYAVCYIYQTLQWPHWPQAQEGYVYLLRYYWNNLNYDAGALLAASSLLIYVLDALLFEHHLSCSFELQHEGYGCLLLLRYAATPYLLSSVSKYFYEQRVPIGSYLMPAGALLLLFVGLCIKRYSCAYKYKYRLNSQNPIFANIDTIHTYQGSRLLLSGLWGHLRQPNYLGDILALCALGAPMYLRPAWPPVLSLLLLVLVLLHRATRANARNQGRYHSSWHRYCTQVRYYILPKIY